jgi:hypothetical protein
MTLDDTNRCFVRTIQESDIRDIKKDKRGKAMSLNGIPIGTWKCLRDIAILWQWLTKLEKAYDKTPRNVMSWALEKHKVPAKYIGLIKDIYHNVVTSVRTSDGDTNDFPIRIGLHQRATLSPYLFALEMDEVTSDIQGDMPRCMLTADNVVLVLVDQSQ